MHVDEIERDELNLRTIGAEDRSSAERKKDAADRKRERDRTRAEQKRRARGCVSREEYEADMVAKKAARAGLSISTMKCRLKEQIEPSPSLQGQPEKSSHKQLITVANEQILVTP